jgi:hypothetical protein
MLCLSHTLTVIVINSNPRINKASVSSQWYLVTLSKNYSIQRINVLNILTEGMLLLAYRGSNQSTACAI